MADDQTKDLLKKWNHSHLVDHFAKNGVDEKLLKEMNSEILAELIPNVLERVAFLKERNNHFENATGTSAKTDRDAQLDGDKENDDDILPDPFVRQNAFVGKTSFYIQTFSVKKCLLDDPDGKNILSAYKRTKSLTPSTRTRIVNIVVRSARNLAIRLFNESFETLAKKIVEVFPTESERTYYVPAVKKKNSPTGHSIASKGKIPIAYRNACSKNKKLNDSVEEKTKKKQQTTEADPTLEEQKKWLSVNNAPWERVVNFWELTRKLRQRDLQKEEAVEIGVFIEQWPILKHPSAYLLIEKDFSELHLTEIRINQIIWDLFFEELKSIRPINLRDSNAVALNEILASNTEINEDTRTTVQILLLPHLVPPLKKVTKKWKPTISECKDSLLLHIKDSGSITRIRDEREKALAKHHKQPLQPFIFVVGPTMFDITDSYVCMGKILYKVPNTLKALEVCFNIFHALDLKFPVESQHLWSIIREGFYRMVPECGSDVSEFMSDLENYRRVSIANEKKLDHQVPEKRNSATTVISLSDAETEMSVEDFGSM